MWLASKRKLMQKFLISLMIFIAALTIIALFSRHAINEKGKHLLTVIENNHYPAEQASDALLLLNQAENDFQIAILSYSPRKLAMFKDKLKQAFLKIDSISQVKVDSSFLSSGQRESMQWQYQQKVHLSDRIFALKNSVDSVLMLADRFTAKDAQADLFNSIERMARKRAAQQVVDTIKPLPVVAPKKGFFRKLKDVFSGKQDTVRNGTTIISNITQKTYQDSLRHLAAKPQTADSFYQQLLTTLRHKQRQLSVNQANMFIINQNMMDQLKRLVGNLQTYSVALSESVKSAAINEYRSTHTLVDNIGLISLLLTLVFALLLIFYVRKIRGAEEQLWQEYELATSLAQQKTDLLAIMSHEIRNPLNSIIGFLKEFKKSGLSDKQTEMMNAVQLSSNMLLATVNDVLDMSKLESGQFQLQTEQFNPYNTLRLTTESVRFSASNKHLAVDYQFTGDRQLNITGDTFRLNQVLLNLLGNAIKFTSEGGITVQAVLKQTGDAALLEVTVTDTGIGIVKAQQERLFTKYYQASSGRGQTGTGLGLYICYKLIHLQGGTIQVNSTPGKGTSIHFSIPYALVQTPATGGVNNTAVNTSVFSGKTILVADDNDLNLKLIKVMTRSWDITLLLAANGKEALDMLQKEQVDVVLTDMEMAEMDGRAVVTAIRKGSFSHLPVVLSTAHRYTAEEEAQMKKAGFTDVIYKPFDEAQLAQKLFIALQTGHE